MKNIDENIDTSDDWWCDGVDNNGNGLIDENEERFTNDYRKLYMSNWAYDLEKNDVIVSSIKNKEYIKIV